MARRPFCQGGETRSLDAFSGIWTEKASNDIRIALSRQEGKWLAAVLACGTGAILSHVYAAAAWDLLRPPSGPIHVTVPPSGRRKRAGIRLHRTHQPVEDATKRCGIPVTTPRAP